MKIKENVTNQLMALTIENFTDCLEIEKSIHEYFEEY